MSVIGAAPSISAPDCGTVTRHLQFVGVEDGRVRQERTMTLLVARRSTTHGILS